MQKLHWTLKINENDTKTIQNDMKYEKKLLWNMKIDSFEIKK